MSEPTAPANWQVRKGSWLIYFRFLAFAMLDNTRAERWQVEATDNENINDESFPRGVAWIRHIEADVLAGVGSELMGGIVALWNNDKTEFGPDGITFLAYLYCIDKRCGCATAIMDAVLERWPNTHYSGVTEEGTAFESFYRKRRGN